MARLLVAMVGLPARGKSWIARHLGRYLAWIGHPTRLFNVGSYRRALLGVGQGAEFFSPTNEAGVEARGKVAREALDDACRWLAEEGEVAIYDATNSTRLRRREIAERATRCGAELLFVESICHDAAIIDANVRATKLSSPDYADVEEAEALADFRARIALYERAYEPLDAEREPAHPFVQIVDLGRDVRLHRAVGPIADRVVAYLLQARPGAGTIFLTRHGQSLANLRERIGGNSRLTALGEAYARNLARFAADRAARSGEAIEVWTSTLRRAVDTARALPFEAKSFAALDEIDAGACDGMTYEEIGARMPEELAARRHDKLRYRYPRGESYVDVIARVDPILLALERSRGPVMVVAHQAILRVFYGFFMDRPVDVVPRLDVPLHTVIELDRHAHGSDERRHPLGPAVRPSRDGD